MFEELYTSLPDRAEYLKRIGIPEVAALDAKTLDALVRAQQMTVPFENLDIYDAQTPVTLEIESLYNKIVVRRRGGYCFELNALFMSLLKSLGFECYPVMVRVVWMSSCYMPITHRAGIVTIDGIRYFCDVGFGGPAPNGVLKLDDPNPQKSGQNMFIFENAPDGDFVIYRITDEGREQLLKFSDRPCENVDFLAPNEYQSNSVNSGFKKMRMVNMTRENGSAAINGNVLRIHKDTQVEETLLDTPEKLNQMLKDHFGIVVDFPLKS